MTAGPTADDFLDVVTHAVSEAINFCDREGYLYGRDEAEMGIQCSGVVDVDHDERTLGATATIEMSGRKLPFRITIKFEESD